MKIFFYIQTRREHEVEWRDFSRGEDEEQAKDGVKALSEWYKSKFPDIQFRVDKRECES